MAANERSPAPKNQRPRDEFGRPLPWGAASRITLADYDALPLEVNHQLALEHLSRREAFSAHEAWESAWRQAKGTADEAFFKGLSQLGAGYTHYLRGNPRGAVTLLARGVSRIRGFPAHHQGVDVDALVRSAEQTIGELASLPGGALLPAIDWPDVRMRPG